MCGIEGRNAETKGEGYFDFCRGDWMESDLGSRNTCIITHSDISRCAIKMEYLHPISFSLCSGVTGLSVMLTKKKWKCFSSLYTKCSDAVCDLVPFRFLSMFVTSEALTTLSRHILIFFN